MQIGDKIKRVVSGKFDVDSTRQMMVSFLRKFVILLILCIVWLIALWSIFATSIDEEKQYKSISFSNVGIDMESLRRRSGGFSMFTRLKQFADGLPRNLGEDAFRNLSDILHLPWKQSLNNVRYFKYAFERETNMSTYDNIMLTKRNTPLNSPIPARVRGTSAKASKYIFDMLPKKSLLPTPPYDTCNIVGSSGCLIGAQCGPLIDEADFVFRFNLAPTAGFESDVGEKSNLTTFNPTITSGTLYNRLRTKKDRQRFSSLIRENFGYVWTPSFSHKALYRWSLRSISIAKDLNPALTFVFGSTTHFRAFEKFWKRNGLRKMASTGFYFISCALSTCKRVNVFGFWPFGKSVNGRDVPYHYHNDIVNKKHNMNNEFKLIIAMHHLGLLKLHIGDCR